MELQSRPTIDPKPILTLAKHLLDSGRAKEALRATSKVLEKDPEHLGALELHVRAQWRVGDLAGALRSLRRLALLNPYEPGYYLMQGDVLNLMGQPSQARRAFERCLSFEGSSAKAEAMSQIAAIDLQFGPARVQDGVREGGDVFDLPYASEGAMNLPAYGTSRPS